MVVNEFNIAFNDTRIAAAQYSTGARVEFIFDQYSTKEQVLKEIQRIPWLNGESATDMGLDVINRQIFAGGYNHHHHHNMPPPVPGRKKIAVVISDGRSTEPDATITAAQRLKSTGVEVFVVGIGKHIDWRELKAIASDDRHIFLVNSSSQLVDIHNKLVKGICDCEYIDSLALR